MIGNDIFMRSELLIGSDNFKNIQKAKVIIFGVGGVGSWCAESLARTGVVNITLVDFDEVCVTNINRQIMATYATIGEKKVEAMKRRLLEINPQAKIVGIDKIYSEESSKSFNLDNYDYVIDAIDTLDNKIYLILQATQSKATLFSSMGAALKLDPLQIKVAEFWKVHTCPLAASLRRKIRKGEKPAKSFLCVFSDEQQKNKQEDLIGKMKNNKIDVSGLADATLSKKGIPNGTAVFVTATFGLTLSSLVIRDIMQKTDSKQKCFE